MPDNTKDTKGTKGTKPFLEFVLLSYNSRMQRLSIIVVALILGSGAGAQTDPKAAAIAWLDANASALGKVNRNIWSWAETGLDEVK
jgi:hypothetical protein